MTTQRHLYSEDDALKCPPCHGNCSQGRDCPKSTDASRRVFGLAPLDPDTTPMHPIRMVGGDELAEAGDVAPPQRHASLGRLAGALFAASALFLAAWLHVLFA